MKKIRLGDQVIVISGKDKGRQGSVQKLVASDRVIVEGVGMVKKHTKPNPQRGISGGILEKESPIHASNLMLINPSTGKADKVGFKFLENGTKVRYFKSNNEILGSE